MPLPVKVILLSPLLLSSTLALRTPIIAATHSTISNGGLNSPTALLLSGKKVSKMVNKIMLSEEEITDNTLKYIANQVSRKSPKIIAGLLSNKGYAVVDNFLDNIPLSSSMRSEAVAYYKSGHMELSQSTRYDPLTNSVVAYNKHNVYSMQLVGGNLYYTGKRLHEYCVAMVKAIVPVLVNAFPDAHISPIMVSNKLAVCIGDGSAYDKHYDNSGLEDTRKVTILYYMNSNWQPDHGGCFRVFNPAGSDTEYTDIAPIADRLLVFWSDRLVHSVEPSFSPTGEYDHRYALTLWLTTESPVYVVRDDAEIDRHFGAMTNK